MQRLFILAIIFFGGIAFPNDPDFGDRVDRGLIEFEDIDEASGIAASQKNENVLWTHNDSGQSRIFALDYTGKHLGQFFLEGIALRDWEDIAVGPGPVTGEHYLYIGDIGDNLARHDLKRIYRVVEPRVSADQAPSDTTLSGIEVITFQYPDGNRDAETLMVDPQTNDLYIVSKRENNVRVYKAVYPQSTTETITLEHVTTLTLANVVAGDISSDGTEILLKTYTTVYYWCREAGQEVGQTFEKSPTVVPYLIEPQGEAICWDANNMGYFTISEEQMNIQAHLYYYPRLVTSVGEGGKLPEMFQLDQNYPNPFNPTTKIRYSLASDSKVRLSIFDLLGKEIAVLVNDVKKAGTHQVEFTASGIDNGLYFYRLLVPGSGGQDLVRKLIVLK